MSNFPNCAFNLTTNNGMAGNRINPNSSVFHSPDKTSVAELNFRAMQAQNRAKTQLNLLAPNEESLVAGLQWDQLRNAIPAGIPLRNIQGPQLQSTAATTANFLGTTSSLPMPPPGLLIPETLVRDILAMIKKEYPWAEALLASKMTKDQFQLLIEKLPELKNIITSRMNTVIAPAAPHLMHVPLPPLPRMRAEMGPQELQQKREAAKIKLIEMLLQVKKAAEVGLLDESILAEPLSPMTLSMVNSMILHAKKLADVKRALQAGKWNNPNDELVLQKRLVEMRQYVQEEQRLYLETLRKEGKEKKPSVAELLKSM